MPKSSPKKRIQTAKYAEYAEKWNAFAYFVYSAVLTAFYFGDVFESPTFCAVLSGVAAVRRGFGRLDSNFVVRHLPDDGSAVNHGQRQQADARKVLHPQQRLLAEFSLAE